MVRRWIALVGLLLLAAAVHANALHNPFVYDDHRMVVDNPSLRDPSNARFVLAFQPFRPLVNASYALDYALSGLEPFGYHRTSLVLHCLNTALLFLLIAGLGAAPRGSRAGPGLEVAAFAAALFAVHPMATETVGYVAGRAELLCASFALASLLCLERALARAPGAGRRAWVAAGLAGFALALACKEVAAMLPAAVLLYDLIYLPEDPGRRRRLQRLYAPVFGALAAGAWLRLYAYRSLEAPERDLGLAANLLTQSGVVWRYLRLFLLPLGQSVVHQVPEVTSLEGLPAAWGALAGAGLAGAAWLAWRVRRREPAVALGALWFLAMLLPSSLIPLPELAAEHRTYLASAGLFLALAALGAAGLRAAALPPARARAAAWAGALALVALLGGLGAARNRVWGDPVRLWSDALQKAPQVFAPHYQLAEALRERGECAAALPYYERAVALVPGYLDARNNLGVCLAQTGRLDDARRAFLAALARDPAYPRARNNLRTLAELEAARSGP